jgi:hypothetical protein
MGYHLGTLCGSGSGWDVGGEGQTEHIRTPLGLGESYCMILLVVRGALMYNLAQRSRFSKSGNLPRSWHLQRLPKGG